MQRTSRTSAASSVLSSFWPSQRCYFPIARRYNSSSTDTDGLVLGVFKGGRLTAAAKEVDDATNGEVTKRLKLSESMKGDAGNSLLLLNVSPKHPRVVLMGLGKDPTATEEKKITDPEEMEDKRDIARQAAGSGVKALRTQGAKTIGVESFDYAQAAAEGAFLGLHKYDALRTGPNDKAKVVNVLPYNFNEEAKSLWNTGATLAAAQNWARTLTEAPSNYMTPTIFANNVKDKFESLDVSLKSKVDIIVRDQKWAEEQKMGCFLGVAKGSDEPPKFLEIHYNGLGDSQADTAPVVLVGKGVTFDSGGISIKPSSGMGLMRGDMGGAAAVVSTLYGIAALGLKARVIALTPLCENMPSGKAVKPGDVLVAKNGKTVEVDNTDAEGRLILADALVYANEFKPHTLIDVATLTGAISVALGNLAAGAFSNSDDLWNEIDRAGRATAERMWRMPLFPAYKEMMKSDYADIRNAGKGTGGSCTAAIFLKEFVSVPRWAHLDIAGVDHNEGEKPYTPKGMTGQPVRTLVEYVKNVHTVQA